MTNIDDDELMRAALGDLDDIPVKKTAPVNPPKPPKPPVDIPVVPPTPPTPPVFPPIDDDPPPEKGKKSKAKIIVPVVLALVLLAAGVGAFFFFNQNAPVTNEPVDDYYYEDNNSYVDDNSYIDDNSYDTTASSSSGSFEFDAYEGLEEVYYDTDTNEIYFDYVDGFEKNINGWRFWTEVYDGVEMFLTTYNNGPATRNVYFCGDADTYLSTGKVSIHPYAPEPIGESTLPGDRDVVPVLCSSLSSASEVNDTELNNLISIATEEFTARYPLATYSTAYFGRESYDHNNCVLIVFDYSDSGYSEIGYIVFYNLIVAENGKLINVDTAEHKLVESNADDLGELEDSIRFNYRICEKID